MVNHPNRAKTAQENVLAALRSMMKGRRWLPLNTLESYDGRAVAALQRRGLIEVNLEYGVRVVVPHNSDNAPCYQAVSNTDATCVHCRSGIMAHNNGKCPQ